MFIDAITRLQLLKRPLVLGGMAALVMLAPIMAILMSASVGAVPPNPDTDPIVKDQHSAALRTALCAGTFDNDTCRAAVTEASNQCVTTGIASTDEPTYPKFNNASVANCIKFAVPSANFNRDLALIKSTLDATEPAVVTAVTDKLDENQANEEEEESEEAATTTCAVDGIGYLVCPLGRAIAGFIGIMYQLLGYFLEVPMISTNPTNSLYQAWTQMRNIANALLVIVFILIIYSQMTGGRK